jgi:formyltetrahydrofolate deformylase
LHASFEAEVAGRFEMQREMRWWEQRRRIGILVSGQDHCLVDLLWRWRRGELDGEIVMVIANHDDVERSCDRA